MLQKRSISIAGHRTSIAVEPEFWLVLEFIAQRRGLSLPRLIAEIDSVKSPDGLASRLRVYALQEAMKAPASFLLENPIPDERAAH